MFKRILAKRRKREATNNVQRSIKATSNAIQSDKTSFNVNPINFTSNESSVPSERCSSSNDNYSSDSSGSSYCD